MKGSELEQVEEFDLERMREPVLELVPELDVEQVRAGGTTEGSYSAPVVCGRGVTKPTRMRGPRPQ